MNVQPVAITVQDQTIRGKLYTPAGDIKKLALLFLHGWTGKPHEPNSVVLAQNGYYSMVFSLRGHNDSDGDIKTISRQDSLADVLAAYDYFKSQLPAATGIVLVGNSYGSYMSALTTVERPVAALSLRVPAPYPDEDFDGPHRGHHDETVMNWRHQPQGWEGNRGFEAVHNFKGPIQIIEAELDELVPHQSVQNYVAAVNNPHQLDYHFMTGWPHSMGNDPQRTADFQKILVTWLKQIADKV